MRLWFVSDTHFGHQNILKFEPVARPFEDTNEMDEILIRNWNAVVAPEDRVIHLGDAIMGNFDVGLARMGRLNGSIDLVPGNHDRVFSGEKDVRVERFTPRYLEVFNEILPETFQMTLSNGSDVLVSHFPYEGDHTESDRHADKRPTNDGLPLIHGHVHSLWHTNGPMFNAGVDVNNLTPVSEDEIIGWVEGL